MSKPAILILNRWHDVLSCYEKYVDHTKYNVFYMTNKRGALSVNKKTAAGLCVLNEISVNDIKKHAISFINRIGKIHKIIAFSEVDQEAAAYLRSALFVPGLKEHQIPKFRNKVIMKNVATQSNILVPKYKDTQDADIDSFISTVKFPIILK